MNINPSVTIDIELSNTEANRMFNLLKPVVFEDDKLFCCLLGPDLRFGIKGFGHTPQEAIEDWETSVRKRIEQPFDNDTVAQYVLTTLGSNGRYATAS